MKVSRSGDQVGHALADVFHASHHDMDDLALPFDMPAREHDRRMSRGPAIAFKNTRPNDQVCNAGFIFERDKHNT